MNIREIINRMNNSEAITSEELAFFETHYDAETMPAKVQLLFDPSRIDPAADYLVIDLDDFDIDDEMADELAYDAANFELAMEACNAFDIMDAPTDDGSWVGR